MDKHVCYVCNQGGEAVASFFFGMAQGAYDASGGAVLGSFIVWGRKDASYLESQGVPSDLIDCFEGWVSGQGGIHLNSKEEAEYLNREFPGIDWSLVAASERSFTDYSMLLGAAGDRAETHEYVIHLLANLAGFFRHVFKKRPLVSLVTQTADTIFSLVSIKVAQQDGIPVRSTVPAWLLEEGKEGGFLAYDEFLHCRVMEERYRFHQTRDLTREEKERVAGIRKKIIDFDSSTSFYKSQKRGKNRIFSPNLPRLMEYVRDNWKKDKRIYYTRFSVYEKIKAHFLRARRALGLKKHLGSKSASELPKEFVFFAMHMQPEQSTLTQGAWYMNQIALIENISKSLPLGYILVVKEHPVNRGFRSSWQYIHLQRLHNVMMMDIPSKEAIRSSEAVITISGTVGAEALALDKPVVVLGRTFYDFSNLLYLPGSIQDLPATLKKVLLEKVHPEGEFLSEERDKFLLSYLEGLIPHYPLSENGRSWGEYLLRNLEQDGLLGPVKNAALLS